MFDPCLFPTTHVNKALQMDPHDSRVVTEYSAKQGSSGFSCGYWPGMDTARMLLTLKQGLRSLEDYIQEYLDLAHFSDLPDCMLIDFFCEGINQPLKSRLIREGTRSSLSQFMDYALLTVGSVFTVGVDEERDTVPVTEMADAPECTHKMADTTTHRHFSVYVKEPSEVTADVKEPSQVPADVKEPSQITANVKEPSQVTADVKEPSQVTTDVNESDQVTVDRHESTHPTTDQPESHLQSQSALQPESLHVSALQPESLHVSALQPESLHVSALQPEPLHVSAELPEPLHVSAELPEPLHVSAELPESITPRDLRSVLRTPCLVSSVRDAPLVSARAAGIPKSTHVNPPVPELIPLSEVLPMIGIALCCIWAAYTTTELPEGGDVHCDVSRGGGICCRTSRCGGARFISLYGGGAQERTLSLLCCGQGDR